MDAAHRATAHSETRVDRSETGGGAVILGISALYHDSAACLIRDGEIIAAAQEERFTRLKHDASFPKKAIRYCLEEAEVGASELTHVCFYEKPLLRFERLIETWVRFAPRGLRPFLAATGALVNEKLRIPHIIDEALDDLYEGPLLFAQHHESHAASLHYS